MPALPSRPGSGGSAHPLNYDPEMWPTVRQALHEVMKPHAQYRLAGLALFHSSRSPPGLYDQRRSKAVQAMDAIIARHGAVIGLGGRPMMTMTTSQSRPGVSFYLSILSV